MIESVELDESGLYEEVVHELRIGILMEGTLGIHLGCNGAETVNRRQMFFLPAGCPAKIQAVTDSRFLVLRFQEDLRLCHTLNLEKLVRYSRNVERPFNPLAVKKCVEIYLDGLLPFLDSGLRCGSYLQIKVHELLFYLRGYYTKEELAAFFFPILDEDHIFQEKVYEQMRTNIKVHELAENIGICYGKLNKRFAQVFGVPPKEYIDTYKKEHLIHELKCGSKPLKTLPSYYGFSSFSAFARFCVTNFGARPTEIRGNVEKRGI